MLLALYVIVGRRFYPKPVVKSAPYYQVINFIQESNKIKQIIGGDKLSVVDCNGRINQFSSTLNFSISFPSKEGLVKVLVNSQKQNR